MAVQVTGSLQRMLPDLVADEAWRPGAQAWADGESFAACNPACMPAIVTAMHFAQATPLQAADSGMSCQTASCCSAPCVSAAPVTGLLTCACYSALLIKLPWRCMRAGLRDRTFLGAVAVGAGLLLVDCVGLHLGGICPMPAHALAPLLRPQALIKVAGAGFAIAYQMG